MLRFDLKYPLSAPVLMLILGIITARLLPTAFLIYGGILFVLAIFIWVLKIRGMSILLGFFCLGFGLNVWKIKSEQLFYLKLANAKALLVQTIGSSNKVQVQWAVLNSSTLLSCRGDLTVNYDDRFKSNQCFWILPRVIEYGEGQTLKLTRYRAKLLDEVGSKDLKRSILNDVFSLSKQYLNTKAFAWYLALIWGDRTQLEKTDQKAFQKLGLAHVISVSGMHLALVFNLLSLPFSILERRYRKISKYRWLLLPFVWLYSWLTPMSPPVVRSAISLTLMVLSKSVFGRRVRNADVYFSVVFIYLIWDPSTLFDIGFQLSLMAMWGIVFIAPTYLKRFEESHLFRQWLANTVVVSIICTLTTLPVIFMEFHQLSMWFLLGNLFMMPLFNGLIYGYALFFIFGINEYVLKHLAWILNHFIDAIDAMLFQFSTLPDVFMYVPRWDWAQFSLLIFAVLCWTFYREDGFRIWKNLCLITVFLLSVEYSIALYICD